MTARAKVASKGCSSKHAVRFRRDAREPHRADGASRYRNSAVALGIALALSLPKVASAQVGSCTFDAGTWTCSGEHPDGIARGTGTRLDLGAVTGAIAPASGPGVQFTNGTGGSLRMIAGAANSGLQIATSGNHAYGLRALSSGASSGFTYIPAINLWAPAGGIGAGGAVTVENFASITTANNDAFGIYAQNQIGGYHPLVLASLVAFDPAAVSYQVISVNGDAVNVGAAVMGSNGGTFTLLGDGTFTFDPGTIFDGLPPDAEFSTSVTYFVRANGQDFAEATLTYTRALDRDGNLQVLPSVSFPQYDVRGLPEGAMLFPDMQAYVDRLLADAGLAGVSEAIAVFNDGQITTQGVRSHGIVAETISGSGSAGVDGNFWGRIPTAGGPGANGGTVEVDNDGSIITSGNDAAGIVAMSVGGTGGRGGEGSTWRFGRPGGMGGRGGDIFVSGDGSIVTSGDRASGIVALSAGGVGGLGGEGVGFTGGALGGLGGHAGSTTITGNMDITTDGLASHGIWARSVGGSGGQGGSDGWIGTGGAGGGGAASNGGVTSIFSGGAITTLSHYAHGIFGQSIGGFGGSGGQAVGLFVGWGGDGGSAGSGDLVDIVNFESGQISTAGNYAHGIFGQSIGGGGGDGGAGVALVVGVGGEAGAGGHGGDVNVVNDGGISTSGNSARGIYAQSIGGGGGDGGASAGIASIGGWGGAGSNAGNVYVGNSGLIETGRGETGGDYSYGIMAQSIGGGGGDGGFAGGLVSLGGRGAGGGLGGEVTIENFGRILTAGDWAHSIFAQSIGGGGGSGGGSFGTLFTLGGRGGAGDDAGLVSITNYGEIVATGFGAQGIHAESVGGGGGSGGSSIATTIAVGGSGGGGGLGGNVDITNAGSIDTSGHLAQGIFAMSVGGGGGNGGSAGSMLITVGGRGGAGTDGGTVDVLNSGLLTTHGNNSAGIFAQSVGGSGGNGGNATAVQIAPVVSFTFALGGTAGTGGDGGAVGVDNTGRIATGGSNSHGIMAQSVGGSGGSGGSATTISAVVPVEGVEIPTITANISIGGRGAGGGEAGTVDVSNEGEILTSGFRSYGVYAQSVGGSGGDGGNATNVQMGIDADISASVAIGGDAGSGGVGNTVTVGNAGLIHTQGAYSNAVFAQSVGGGGGAGGDATTVSLSMTPPPGSPSDLIPTPSMSFTLAVGGDGGAGGIGGEISVTNAGSIVTEGHFAAGVMAQSVGGSGGTGGDARSIQVDLSANPMDFIPWLDLISFDTTLVFGGDGGSGGHGGDVTATNESDIETDGAFAHGIVAQSIGGGGGSGGSAMTFEFSNTDLPIPEIPVLDDVVGLTNIEMTLQGSGGGGGDGGDVELFSAGDIWTAGDFAMGVVAQSIAGGGGLAGMYNPHGITGSAFADAMIGMLMDTDAGISFAGSVGGQGTAGDVLVHHTGTIRTLGDAAHGLFAQSASGQGVAGSVNVTLDGSILALGDGSFGIYAQSGGGAGNGAITLTLDGGVVMGGGGTGGGILIVQGGNNRIVNNGLVSSVPGVYGNAVVATSGSEFVENHGTVTGSVYLGSGANRVENYGVLNTGTTYDIGAGNLLLNAGDLAPGGILDLHTTQVLGNFAQAATGTLWYDVNFASNTADLLNISGTAELGGTLTLLTTNAGHIMPGTHQIGLLTSAGGITGSGLTLNVAPSAVISYALTAPSANQRSLQYSVDFAPAQLNLNRAAIGEHINDIQRAGGSERMEALTGSLVAIPDPSALAFAYDLLSPESVAQAQVGALLSSIEFGDALLSCRARDGQFRFIAEGECAWMRASYRSLEREADSANLGFEEDTAGVAFGFQNAIGDHWYAGVAMSLEDVSLDTDGLATTDGTRGQGGLVLKGSYGADLFAAGLSGGFASFDTRRRIDLPASGLVAEADHQLSFLAGRLRWARLFERGDWYLKPGVDLALTHLDSDGFRETGAGAANLEVSGHSETYLSVGPTLELGGEKSMGNGLLLRPFVQLGAIHFLSGDDPQVSAIFQGAPQGVSAFTVYGDLDETFLDVAVGADLFTRAGTVLRLNYVGQFSDHTDSHGVFLRLSMSL